MVYWLVLPTSRLRVPVWSAPALVMFALGVWRLGRPGMWADELATWGAARMPLGDMLRMLGEVDAVDGLYYLAMNLWIRVAGDSEFALRFPSVLAMAAAAGLLAVLGRRLVSYRAGLVAGLAFTLVPAASRYAQEARVYPFVILGAVVATLLMDRILRRPSKRLLIGYAVTVALMGLLHILAILIVAAHGVVALLFLWRARRPVFWRWFLAASLGVLPVLPLIALSIGQTGQVSWIPESSVRTVIALPEKLTSAAAVGGFLVALAVLAYSRRRSSVLVLSWLVVPPAVLFVAAQFHELFWYRYLLFTMPALVLAAGITLARAKLVPIVAGLVALAALGANINLFYRWPDGHEHDTRGVGALIAAEYRPGDAVAYALHEPVVPWEARDVVARYVPADRRPRDAFALVGQRAGDNFLAEECPDDQLVRCLADAPRVWVVRFEDKKLADPLKNLTDPAKESGAKERLLRDGYRLERAWAKRAFTVGLYVRSS